MSAESVLDVKIRALVEGLANVANLAAEIRDTGKASTDAADASKVAAKETEDAYKTLGIRSFADIKAEIEKTKTAYARLVSSGKLSANELANATGAVKSKLVELNEEFKSGGKTAEESFTKANTPLGVLKQNLGALIGAFTALAVAYGLKESADYAARTETLGVTLGVVAKNAGYSGEQIGKYEGELKGLGITTQAARQSLTQMIQAGLPLGPTAEGGASSIAKLARAAQDLAVVTGENSSATLTRLITNIQQMDTEGLRFMGLTVNVTAAQQKFALSLGKTAEQLTQQQKTQAVMNEVLVQSAALSGAYAASMETVGKKLQSVKRYQEELANDVGKQLLPAYGALVDAVTNFLKEADKTVGALDQNAQVAHSLADHTRAFFDGLGGLLSQILKIGADVYPTLVAVGVQFLDLATSILTAATALLSLEDATDSTGKKVNGLAAALKDVLIAIGILVAGFRDGLTIIGALLSGLAGAALDFAGVFLQSWGKVVGFFNKDLGAALTSAGNSLRSTAKDLIGFADDTVDKFGRGETALGQFNKELAGTKELASALAKANDFTTVEEQIRKLLEAKRENTKNDVELKAGADQVAAAIARLGGESKLSAGEIAKLNAELAGVTKDSKDIFIKSLNDMGLSLQKIGDTEHLLPLNKELGVVGESLKALAVNANTTGLQFQEAFAKGIDTAKSVKDLTTLSGALADAKARGMELGEANKELVGRFEEVFTAALKAAKTKSDFALLTAEVVELGNKGSISAGLVASSIAEIQAKAKGARVEVLELKKDLVDMAQSSVNIAKSHLDMVRADVEVGRARLGVWVAQNKYAKDGTDLAAQELKYAELNLTAARARAEEARLAYAQAQAQGALIISQLQQQVALERLKLDVNNEGLIVAANAAAAEVAGAQEAFNITKAKALAQQEAVMRIEEELLKQKLVVEQAQAAAQEAKNVAGAAASAANSLGAAAGNAQALASGIHAAADAAQTLAGNSSQAAQQLMRMASALDGIADAQKRLDDANGVKPGVKTLGDGGIGANNAKNQSVTGENKSYADRQEGFTSSAEENRYWDFVEGKGTLGEEDRAYVEGVWQAAQANMETMQRNSTFFSQAGVDSVIKKYNEARRAMEALRRKSAGTSATVGGTHSTGGSSTGGASAPHAYADSNGSGGTGTSGGSFAQLANGALSQVNAGSSGAFAMSDSALQSAASQAPSKVVQVNFTDATGAHIPLTTDAGNVEPLLALLQRAKGTAT